MEVSLHKSPFCSFLQVGKKTRAFYVRGSSNFKNENTVSKLKVELLNLIRESRRGVNTNSPLNSKILDKVDAFSALNYNNTTSENVLSANWRLLWTTEKETLFIFKNAPLFGTTAGETLQPIDVKNGTLENIITFPPEGEFRVKAEISVVSSQRVEFKFTGAHLICPLGKLSVPPFGEGWFDNVYVDDDIRISKDSRGDVLITERA